MPDPLPKADRSKYPKKSFDYTTQHGAWPNYSGNPQSHKYSPLNQINRATVDGLELAWVFESESDPGPRAEEGGIKTPDPFKGTPIMVDNTIYLRTRFSTIDAIDPTTGEQLWSFDPGTAKGRRPPMFGFSTRGLSYYRAEGGGRIIYTSSDGWLIALDSKTGKLIEGFGEGGKVNLKKQLRREMRERDASWSNTPTVCNDVIVVGSQVQDSSEWLRGNEWQQDLPVGDVRGFDANSGKLLWTFHTIPQNEEFGVDTWENDSWKWVGNVNVWTQMSCDPDLNHVYLPLSAPTQHFYGGFRPGDNLFSTSIVALNLKTGERVWHFQTVHHDIWDYDLPAAPTVVDITVKGKPIRALVQVSKVGFLYVLNRESGEPVWEVAEREVPSSTIEGEIAAKTQPHPMWPPPVTKQGFTEDDIPTITPEFGEAVRQFIAGKRIGPLFTPPSREGTVINPGIGGGTNWPGAAFNPETQFFYTESKDLPMVVQVQPVNRPFRYRIDWQGAFVGNIPITEPPWATIVAYDLKTGDMKWRVANGAGPKDSPLLRSATDLPDLGNIGAYAGVLATPELVFFPTVEKQVGYLRALDARNGKKLWERAVPGRTEGAPAISYSIGDRQYVVISSGSSLEPARLSAFTLKLD